jgi:hypothetical protein
LKILFQGGWKAGRNSPESQSVIEDYCKTLARYVVDHNHTLVLGSYRQSDKLIADEIATIAQSQAKNIKDHLMFLLPQRENVLPKHGRVIRIPERAWWIEEHTYSVQNTDALICIGGGRGTFDCVEKALLSRKPVFVAASIPCKATTAWKNRPAGYKYFMEGDADVLEDVNITPKEFFLHVFPIIDRLSAIVYSRRIFIVHGHNHYLRDTLANILREPHDFGETRARYREGWLRHDLIYSR